MGQGILVADKWTLQDVASPVLFFCMALIFGKDEDGRVHIDKYVKAKNLFEDLNRFASQTSLAQMTDE